MSEVAQGSPTTLLAQWRERADDALVRALERPAQTQPRLLAAMRHAVLLGGKRMRPLLAYATAHALGGTAARVDDAAAAVELVHAYSLVHDDLPAMDDDALRRGQPTVHVAFDEATAILAGDALQSLAFSVLANSALPAHQVVAMLAELASAAGADGMCGGQAFDLAATGGKWDQVHSSGPLSSLDNEADPISSLERLHALKTGALIRAAVRLGAIASDAGADTRAALDDYADALGLAFQIRDDLLDVEGDSATLGKTAGKDLAQDKATFPALIGLEASNERLRDLGTRMARALQACPGDTAPLAALARRAIERDH